MRVGNTSSTKCFNGKVPVTRPKLSASKQKTQNRINQKLPESYYQEGYSIRRRGGDAFALEGLYSFASEEEMRSSRVFEKQCEGCKRVFPLNVFKAHVNGCEEVGLKREKKRVRTEQKREASKKSKPREEPRGTQKEAPLPRKEPKQKQSVRKEIKKKVVDPSHFPQPLRKREQRQKEKPRTSIKKQSRVQIKVNANVRAASNRARRSTNRRRDSEERFGGLFNIFRDIHEGFIPMDQELRQLFANVISRASNIMSHIPRMGGIVWYENIQPEESFTEVYYDYTEGRDGNGLHEEQINQIPVHRYQTNDRHQNTHSTNKSCAVCLNDFRNGEAVKTLQCEHCYHRDCIDQWLNLNGTCPVCRNDLH